MDGQYKSARISWNKYKWYFAANEYLHIVFHWDEWTANGALGEACDKRRPELMKKDEIGTWFRIWSDTMVGLRYCRFCAASNVSS